VEDQFIDELAAQVRAAFEERTVLPSGDRFGGYEEGSLEDFGFEPVAREDLDEWVPDE
jgi:hypothetical protein